LTHFEIATIIVAIHGLLRFGRLQTQKIVWTPKRGGTTRIVVGLQPQNSWKQAAAESCVASKLEMVDQTRIK
jgi:hypothetical protein